MKSNSVKSMPKVFVIDVDGVFTDGKFYYSESGKVMKKFGPDDNDALSIIENKLTIHCVTGDKRGFGISKRRIETDMGLKLSLVSTFERIEWINKYYDAKTTIYMGDGIYDPLVFRHVLYGIAPANAFYATKKAASYVTKNRGGEGAVAEACIHILETFFDQKFDVLSLDMTKGSGNWKYSG